LLAGGIVGKLGVADHQCLLGPTITYGEMNVLLEKKGVFTNNENTEFISTNRLLRQFNKKNARKGFALTSKRFAYLDFCPENPLRFIPVGKNPYIIDAMASLILNSFATKHININEFNDILDRCKNNDKVLKEFKTKKKQKGQKWCRLS
jgi:hypothetical protein